jgi:N utilization substance protein A
MAAVNQICDEKGLTKDQVIETIEAALAAAYRRDFGHPDQEIRVDFDPEKSTWRIFRQWETVATEEELENKHAQLLLADAQKIKKGAKVAEIVELEQEAPEEFGRIAAQTAKQVVIQRLREAERDVLFDEFKKYEAQVLVGHVQQLEGPNVVVNLGKINGFMPPREQSQGEEYHVGQRIKVFVKEVAETGRGLSVIVSRTDNRLIAELFKKEVPEIADGMIEIKALAREAGSRTKIAIWTEVTGLDPVGSCVGQRGTRVQAILSEVGEEKIDITIWDENVSQFIVNALSPARIARVEKDDETMHATVYVDEDQLSLAIGRGGQNVRLASKLTGYAIDVERADGQERRRGEQPAEATSEATTESTETPVEAPAKPATDAKPAKKTAKSKKK